MKTLIVFVFALAFSSQINAACNNSTIKGEWAGAGNLDSFGFVANGTESNLIFTLGRFIFNGEGRLTIRNAKFSIAGQLISSSGAGNYSVSPSCVGRATVNINLFEFNATARIRYDFIVSGNAEDSLINALYTEIVPNNSIGESGLMSLNKISFTQ